MGRYKKMYSYKDIITGKIKSTRGRFVGWTKPTGLLAVPYAIFSNPSGDILVPKYLLTQESKKKIDALAISFLGNKA